MAAENPKTFDRFIMATPIGEVFVEANAKGVTRILFVDKMDDDPSAVSASNSHSTAASNPLENPHVADAVRQLEEYFAGKRTEFDLVLAPQGTAFQQQVWQALREIPYGEHCSYLDLANRIDNPKAVRAVGAANGRNPLSIVVPCHRVIGKSGKLTGYAGGLERKAWLLALERKVDSGESARTPKFVQLGLFN